MKKWEVLKAYEEGKEIEAFKDGKWEAFTPAWILSLPDTRPLRIKPT